MRYKLYFLTILTYTMLACQKKEEAPSPIPAIKAGSVTNTAITHPIAGKGDSITFTVSYRDGDSDLGLNVSEIGKSPYQQTNPDGTPNQFFYNFFVEIYHKHNGNFHLAQAVDPIQYNVNGIFLYIGNLSSGTIDLQDSPFKIVIHNSYEGELTYRLKLYRSGLSQIGLSPGDVLKLRVQLADRALHLSNTVDSPEFVLSQ